MGVLKRPLISKNMEEVPPNIMIREFKNADDIAFDDNCGEEEALQEPRKRRFGRSVECETEEDEPETTPAKAAPAAPTNKAADKKVRLSADITKSLHRQLKLYSLNSDQTILTIIESWIMKYCPK